jgi:hypothetical protein
MGASGADGVGTVDGVGMVAKSVRASETPASVSLVVGGVAAAILGLDVADDVGEGLGDAHRK